MLSLTNVSKQYGPQILFVGATCQVNRGEKIGLVGPNGAGKSTLFRLILGEESADEGQIEKPKKLTIGYFRQDAGDMSGRTVLAETVAGAGETAALGEELVLLERAMEDPEVAARLESERGLDFDRLLTRYGEVQARFQELGGYELDARAHEILHGLGFSQEQVNGDVGKLSGGWKMRVALARILLSAPELMLLDEPTNYLDIESIVWLEQFLRDTESAVVMTCHDRDVMNRVVGKIVEIDGGELSVYSGNYDFYESAREMDRVQREAAFARQQAMLEKEQRFIDRFKAHAAKAAQVQSRVKKLDKVERIVPPKRMQDPKPFEFKPAPRSGDDVVRALGVTKQYGARKVHDGLDWLVRRGERWALMGENGAGKTTLLKMVAGVTKADGGKIDVGASVVMGYFAQHQMEQLSASRTVIEELTAHAPLATPGTLRNLAGAFGFSGDDVEKPIEVLSGGEKARVALAKILFDGPNLLVLDEPTNHLDIVTKRVLIRALSGFEGTILFVSHDRQFLRALANRVLELLPTGPVRYDGSYDEYVTRSGHEAPGLRSQDPTRSSVAA